MVRISARAQTAQAAIFATPVLERTTAFSSHFRKRLFFRILSTKYPFCSLSNFFAVLLHSQLACLRIPYAFGILYHNHGMIRGKKGGMEMHVKRPSRGTLALTVSSLAFAMPAMAQDAGSAAGKPDQAQAQADNEDFAGIIVTAMRRETALLKTPAAVSVLTNEQLVARGITNPTQLTQEVPNLFINRSNAGYIQATIRGVSSQDITE
ncbi:TonB-dependent receptor plug domain-containing protein, partial [Novosphingobium sp.]|uniref:TonB-dependent receptor plug domain-containing protein n=1 Tax=Novosphingobium sp. TaxID=1874826 RepID=UPI00263910A0